MIKEYRIKQKYTQEELAELLNLSTRQIQRIETEQSYPKLKTLKKMVLILKMEDKDIANYIKNMKDNKL